MSHALDSIDVPALREAALAKWTHFDAEILPLWVADMDFPLAEPIREALREQAEAPVFGYIGADGLPGLREAMAERVAARYGWPVDPAWVVPLPGIVPGLDASVRAFASRGDGVVIPTPVYPPFLGSVRRHGRVLQAVDLREGEAGPRLRPEDLDAAITPGSRLLMLCHPHNPTGRVFDEAELDALAERVLKHRLWAVSDEVHADLNYGAPHHPFASRDRELARRTVTLYGPSKPFNIAGLGIGFAVAENDEVRARFREAAAGAVPKPNGFAQVAALAAYRHGDGWLRDTLLHLRHNRDHLVDAVRTRLPGVRVHAPEATYLAWLDFRATPLAEAPAEALREAGVALNDGLAFGEAGRGYARLNFATSREILDAALDRIEGALVAA